MFWACSLLCHGGSAKRTPEVDSAGSPFIQLEFHFLESLSFCSCGSTIGLSRFALTTNPALPAGTYWRMLLA
jgi:hypothetical protein